jgi:hypothetical protein
MGALTAGARLFFLAVSFDSRSMPGFWLESTQEVELALSLFFSRTIWIDKRRTLARDATKNRIGESYNFF